MRYEKRQDPTWTSQNETGFLFHAKPRRREKTAALASRPMQYFSQAGRPCCGIPDHFAQNLPGKGLKQCPNAEGILLWLIDHAPIDTLIDCGYRFEGERDALLRRLLLALLVTVNS